MRKYELALVLIANLGEEDRLSELAKVKETITRFGGQITNVDDWGKRKLAYEIKKVQKHKEGFYYFIHFDAETSVPAELESRLRIMEKVLRYLIISLEDK